MIKELIKLATHLDERGLVKEADYLDAAIRKLAVHGCESYGVALSVAKMKMDSCKKVYDTKCTGDLLKPVWTEGQFDQACLEADIVHKEAIDEYEIAAKNYEECVGARE